MDITTSLFAIIIITSLTSSMLSLGAKLIYDGIKAKKNGTNGNGVKLLYSIQNDIALLSKDVDESNKEVVELKRSLEMLYTAAIETNVHLKDLKQTTANQTNEFRTLVIALTTAIAKLE